MGEPLPFNQRLTWVTHISQRYSELEWISDLKWSVFCFFLERHPHPVWRALLPEACLCLAWTIPQPAAKLLLNLLCGNNWRRLSWRSPHPSPLPQNLTSCPLQPTTSSFTWLDWKKSYRICWIPFTEVCRFLSLITIGSTEKYFKILRHVLCFKTSLFHVDLFKTIVN